MKDFRIIVTEDRKDFELKIEKNLKEGYKMINSNLTVYKPIQRTNQLNPEWVHKTIKNLIFYAYMEKETEE